MEKWKDIDGYEGRYQISNFGNVKSLDRIVPHARGPRVWKGRLLNGYTHRLYPYKVVNLYVESKLFHITIHRLVALAFVPLVSGKNYVNHIDGNKLNNHFSNLEWTTLSENMHHAHRTGLMANNTGSKRYNSKLKESDIPIIKGLYKHLGLKLCQIAPMFSVDRMLIRYIIDGKKWQHVA